MGRKMDIRELSSQLEGFTYDLEEDKV